MKQELRHTHPDMASTMRRRLEVQGYGGLDDETVLKLDPWFRLVPVVTALIVAFSSLMRSPGILLATAFVSVAGALSSRHPLDVVYNAIIRHIEGSPELPPTSRRRRAAFLVWAALLAFAAWCLRSGHGGAGLALAWSTAAMIGWSAAQQQCLVAEILACLSRKPPAPPG